MEIIGIKIALANDHAGFPLKQKVKQYLLKNGYGVMDYGSFSESSADYPDFVHPLARSIIDGTNHLGIVMCGSGNGVNMTANKHQGIRSALCWMPEIARLARLHNNANVLAMPARFIDEESALETVNVFLTTEFEGGRHFRRVEKISR